MVGTEFSNGHEDHSVLVVNDFPEQLNLMGGLLRKAGYSVFTAEDGVAAFNLAKENRPDLVISDVSMPRMNGLEFCRRLRADDELRSIPILLVSALRKDTESVVAGLRAGADDYLEVPFDATRLVAKVSRLLERARLEATYRDLVEQATDMIFTQDLSGKITSINAAGAKFFGRTQSELIGESFFSAFGIIPESNGFAGSLQRLPSAKEFRHQFVAREASGRDRWLDLVLSPLRDKFEEPIGFRGVARDITERKHVELALRDSEERIDSCLNQLPNQSGFITKRRWAFLLSTKQPPRRTGIRVMNFCR
ncbi:MAG: response regulator [Pyrinomonadaceae bacterium]